MNRKHVLWIILLLTFLLIGLMKYLNNSYSYKKFAVSKRKWEEIRKNRSKNQYLEIKDLTINDIPVIIDQEHHIIYYTNLIVLSSGREYIHYTSDHSNTKIALLDENNSKLMIYTDNAYHTYQLVLVNKPMIQIKYDGVLNRTIDAEILFIDNDRKASRRINRSSASITLENHDKYFVSLRKESVGRKERENDISIFGMQIAHDFLLNKVRTPDIDSSTEVELFINQINYGIYYFEYNNRVGG